MPSPFYGFYYTTVAMLKWMASFLPLKSYLGMAIVIAAAAEKKLACKKRLLFVLAFSSYSSNSRQQLFFIILHGGKLPDEFNSIGKEERWVKEKYWLLRFAPSRVASQR